MLWHSVFCICSFGFFVAEGKISWALAKLTRNIMSCLFLKAWAGINRDSGILRSLTHACKNLCVWVIGSTGHQSKGFCCLHCLWQPSIVRSDFVPAVDAASPHSRFLSPDHSCACVYSKILGFASNMHRVFSWNCVPTVLKSLELAVEETFFLNLML